MFGDEAAGGDKGLLDLGGRPMLAHVVARFAPQVGRLALSANGEPARFSAFGLPVIADIGGGGPLAGILAGMRWAESLAPGVPWIATVSADTPFLPLDLVSKLAAAIDGAPRTIALAVSGGRAHHVIGLWPVALAPDLAWSLEQGWRKALAWAERHDNIRVEFPFAALGDALADPFFNVNAPDDLALARRILKSRRSVRNRC